MPMENGFQVPSILGRPFYFSISGALIELGKTQFVASWIIMSKYWTDKIFLFCSSYLILWWRTELPAFECTGGMHHFYIYYDDHDFEW